MSTLKLEKRTESGKGAARRLRQNGTIPGVIYGAGKEPTPVTVDIHDLMMIVKEGGFYSRILDVNIDGTKEKVLPRELQRDPVKRKYQHLDLLRFDPKKKLTLNVPIHVVGEEESPGVEEGGVLQVIRSEVEVLCLATNIPEQLEVSVAALNIGDNVRFSDMPMPEGVELTDEEDRTIASIVTVQEEPEPEEELEAAEGEEGEEGAEGEGEESEEGDESAEGDASDEGESEEKA